MFVIISRTMKPIAVVAKHLGNFAKADFTNELPATYMDRGDEIGILAKASNKMQSSIRNMIENVVSESSNTKLVVENTSKYMNVLSENMRDISETTQQLSAGMEETAAYTENINSTTNDIEKSNGKPSAKSSGRCRIYTDFVKQSFIASSDSILNEF
jgi:methyl-accepting chemotaxis protein